MIFLSFQGFQPSKIPHSQVQRKGNNRESAASKIPPVPSMKNSAEITPKREKLGWMLPLMVFYSDLLLSFTGPWESCYFVRTWVTRVFCSATGKHHSAYMHAHMHIIFSMLLVSSRLKNKGKSSSSRFGELSTQFLATCIEVLLSGFQAKRPHCTQIFLSILQSSSTTSKVLIITTGTTRGFFNLLCCQMFGANIYLV